MIRRPGLEVRMWPLSKMASTIWTRWTRGDAIASPPEMWPAARWPHAIMAAGSETPSRRSSDWMDQAEREETHEGGGTDLQLKRMMQNRPLP
jgi:hypothetical protein